MNGSNETPVISRTSFLAFFITSSNIFCNFLGIPSFNRSNTSLPLRSIFSIASLSFKSALILADFTVSSNIVSSRSRDSSELRISMTSPRTDSRLNIFFIFRAFSII